MVWTDRDRVARPAVAAGVQAEAIHDGAVVFGDHTSSTVRSRASGELRSQMPVHAPACYRTSTRASKTDLAPVDPQDALDGVEDLSVRRWEPDRRGDDRPHVGPMAEGLHERFDLGGGDSIATADTDSGRHNACNRFRTRVWLSDGGCGQNNDHLPCGLSISESSRRQWAGEIRNR